MKGKFFCDVFEKKLIFAKVARSTVGDSTLSPGIVTSKIGYTYIFVEYEYVVQISYAYLLAFTTY
jgi:hypothetical protein